MGYVPAFTDVKVITAVPFSSVVTLAGYIVRSYGFVTFIVAFGRGFPYRSYAFRTIVMFFPTSLTRFSGYAAIM